MRSNMNSSKNLFEVSGLAKRFSGITAVDDLSYGVEAGAILGLIGPNGCGKSTSIDCISGFQRPDEGRWTLCGEPLKGLAPHRIARAGLVRTFQNVRAYQEMSLVDNLLVAAQESDGRSWLSSVLRSPGVRRSEQHATDRAMGLLAQVGLERYADAPASILSYGQAKLLAIAASMMTRPRLVILDEPVAGVNPTMVRRIEGVLRTLRAEGVTLVIVEHNVDFITNLCDRIVVMESGRKIADGAPSLIRTDERVLAAYLGKGDRT